MFVFGGFDELKKVGRKGWRGSDGGGFFGFFLVDTVEEVGMVPIHDGFAELGGSRALVVVGREDDVDQGGGAVVVKGGIFPVVVFPVVLKFVPAVGLGDEAFEVALVNAVAAGSKEVALLFEGKAEFLATDGVDESPIFR